jgi:hypothetical protein
VVWYGWEVLAADASVAAFSGLGALAFPNASTGYGAIAGIGYVVDGPVIHLLRRRYLAAALSLGMRLSFPIAGAAIGAGVASCGPPPDNGYPSDPCWASFGGAVYGFAAGMVVALIVDVAALSWDHAPPPGDEAAPKASHVWLLPRIAAIDDASHRRVVSVGVAGAF